MCRELDIEVDYTGIDGVQKYLASKDCSLLSTDYGGTVRFCVAVKKADSEQFESGLVDYMQGRVKIARGAEYYAPFQE